jgi:hypothetical protein
MLCLPLRVRTPGGYLRSSGAVGMSSRAPERLARRCDISGESSRDHEKKRRQIVILPLLSSAYSEAETLSSPWRLEAGLR